MQSKQTPTLAEEATAKRKARQASLIHAAKNPAKKPSFAAPSRANRTLETATGNALAQHFAGLCIIRSGA